MISIIQTTVFQYETEQELATILENLNELDLVEVIADEDENVVTVTSQTTME